VVSLTGPVFVNRYTKTNREDNSGCHQLELGWIKVTNLLPESPYRVSRYYSQCFRSHCRQAQETAGWSRY